MDRISALHAPARILSSRGDPYGNAFETARSVAKKHFWVRFKFHFGDAGNQRCQHHLSLQSCQHLADTAVNAGAETEMPAIVPADVEAIRILPTPGVPIGRCEGKINLLAFGNPYAINDGLARSGAEKSLDRRLDV